MPGAITAPAAPTYDADILLAYSCSDKKRHIFENLSKEAENMTGINLVPYEALNGHKCDALLHKRTDELVAAMSGDLAAKDRMRDFKRMFASCMMGVDELAGVKTLIDRAKMAFAVEKALVHTPAVMAHFRHLKWCVVRADQTLEKTLADFQYPVIIKRRMACGSPESHVMAVCHNADKALEAARSMVDGADELVFVQEYVQHHAGVLFKLYAMGERVEVQARSVKQDPKCDHHFDSQVMSRSAETLSAQAMDECSAPMIARNLASRVSTMMRVELNLHLIGIDVIWDAQARKYAIVDVNYFPGYKGVKDANRSILLHAAEQVRDRRRLEALRAHFGAGSAWVNVDVGNVATVVQS